MVNGVYVINQKEANMESVEDELTSEEISEEENFQEELNKKEE